MQATERLWRTADGKLVGDGDEAAAQLAYTPGDEIAARDESLVPGHESAAQVDEKPRLAGKAAAKPADKQASKPADK